MLDGSLHKCNSETKRVHHHFGTPYLSDLLAQAMISFSEIFLSDTGKCGPRDGRRGTQTTGRRARCASAKDLAIVSACLSMSIVSPLVSRNGPESVRQPLRKRRIPFQHPYCKPFRAILNDKKLDVDTQQTFMNLVTALSSSSKLKVRSPVQSFRGLCWTKKKVNMMPRLLENWYHARVHGICCRRCRSCDFHLFMRRSCELVGNVR